MLCSRDCVGCGLSIRQPDRVNLTSAWMMEVTVLRRHHKPYCGLYDGYGKVFKTDPDDSVAPLELCGGETIWHLACWEAMGCPKRKTKPSLAAYDQGYIVGNYHPTAPVEPKDVEVLKQYAEQKRSIFKQNIQALLDSLQRHVAETPEPSGSKLKKQK